MFVFDTDVRGGDCQTPLTIFCTAYGFSVVPNKFGSNVAHDGIVLLLHRLVEALYDRICCSSNDRVNTDFRDTID